MTADLEKLVKPLVWENIGRCVGWSIDNENTHLHSAFGCGQFYELSKGNTGWQAKWRGEYHATEMPTLEAAKAAAQADYASRIAAALDPDAVAAIRAKAIREAYWEFACNGLQCNILKLLYK